MHSPIVVKKVLHPSPQDLPENFAQRRKGGRSRGLRSWGDSREQSATFEKDLMAVYFVNHDFLVRDGLTPESPRETAASIIVNQGTTPNRVVEKAVEWVKEHHHDQGPFFLTWYTPGHLVPVTLRLAREVNRNLKTALRLFLFPGEVDEETESVSGPDAERFVARLQTRFTYAFLSAYSFDVCTGDVYFFSPKEICLQKQCATRFAAHKFLFLDPSKFRCEGEKGYSISDLLDTSYSVTIYTVSSAKDDWIRSTFRNLCDRLLSTGKETKSVEEQKRLRLRIVGGLDNPSQDVDQSGVLVNRTTQKRSSNKGRRI